MKKWVFWLVLILLLGIDALMQPAGTVTGGNPPTGSTQVMKANTENTELLAIGNERKFQGHLLLVNRQYPVKEEGVASDVVKLVEHPELRQGYGLLDNSIRISLEVAQQFSRLVADAADDGVQHFLISSGYRDHAEQALLYEEKGSRYALPAGYSEHNLGLGLDIGSTEQEMESAPEGRWLAAHAADYGFILRYPADKTSVTGIEYEPWHFRYVGLPHSLIMREKNFTLEEYLAFLKAQQSYSATVSGKVYRISYYAVSGNTVIPVPVGRYDLSGNNMDGVIVTEYP